MKEKSWLEGGSAGYKFGDLARTMVNDLKKVKQEQHEVVRGCHVLAVLAASPFQTILQMVLSHVVMVASIGQKYRDAHERHHEKETVKKVLDLNPDNFKTIGNLTLKILEAER